MLIITDNRAINFNNITVIQAEKDYTKDEGYLVRAYDNNDDSYILGEYDNEERAQIELSRFINSYIVEKKIHRFEGD